VGLSTPCARPGGRPRHGGAGASGNPERFGTGDIRGVANPESANNAASGASLIPLLSLGIPGGGATAVMLGALMMLDITPGRMMFEKHGALLWALIASMYVGNGAAADPGALEGRQDAAGGAGGRGELALVDADRGGDPQCPRFSRPEARTSR
jgi:hypothetical protein